MRLQSQDFITANQIQKELARLVPNDPTIRAFAAYLPAEAEYQEEVMNEEAAAQDEEEDNDSYYDEEDDGDGSNSSGDE